MTNARSEILARIHTALQDRPSPPPVVRDYRTATGLPGDVELFVERVGDYRATVVVVPTGTPVASVIAAQLLTRGRRRVAAPPGLPWRSLPGVEMLGEPLDTATLDEVGAVVSTCAVAIAETGTVVLDGSEGMGRRALSLVPDYHLVVVRRGDIVAGVPDALRRLDPVRPQTWISGPSATSDIELDRVEGVHGPRTLDVLVV